MVHRVRGTKSKFNYSVPSRSQLVPQLNIERAPATSSALDGLVSYRSSTSVPQPPSTNPDKNAGVQAREKVLEAIAPLRRGRPAPVSLHHSTGPSSPTREKIGPKSTELEFKDAEDESWKAARGAVRGHRSGLASPTRWPPPVASLDDAWNVAGGSGAGADADKAKNRDRRKTVQVSLGGFGDSFEGGLELPSITTARPMSTSSSPWLSPQPSAKPLAPTQRPSETASRIRAPNKPKDAFDGLGLPSDRLPVPTLGDVQKARTGTSASGTTVESSSSNLTVPGRGTSYTSSTSSPRPSPSPRLSPKGPSPAPSTSTSWRPSHAPLPQAQSNASKVDLSVEQRFPALEDLDSALLTAGPPRHASTLSPSQEKKSPLITPSSLPPKAMSSAFTGPRSPRTGGKHNPTLSRGGDIHSEQTTGPAPLVTRDVLTPKRERTESQLPVMSPSRIPRLPTRAAPPKRQVSLTLRTPPAQALKSNEPPSPAQIMGRPEPQDWLTGPEDDLTSGTTIRAVLKESPGKRSSVIVERGPHIPSPQEAVAVSDKQASPPPSPTPAPRTTSSWIMAMKQTNAETGSGRQPLQPKSGRASAEPRVSAPPPADSWKPTHKRQDTTSTMSSDDGPEEATGYGPPRLNATREPPQRVGVKKTGGSSAGGRRRSKSKSRQGSVHELVDLWGGKEGRTRTKSFGGDSRPSTGSKPITQEPEDVNNSSKLLLFPPAGQSPKPRSVSPAPLISPSISADSIFTRYDLPSAARGSPRHRKQSTNGRDAGPPPSASAIIATPRPRPQSMFLNSPTTAAVKFPVSSPADSSSANLDVPSPDTRSRRTTRRTSISDMVQRYEAMGGSAGPSPASRQPTSSAQTAQLGVSSLSRSTTTHVSSSRRSQLGAVGLPGLATDPSKKPPSGIGVSDKPHTEYASPIGLPGLAVERKSSASYGARRSPVKLDATGGIGGSGGLDAPIRPIPMRSFSPVPPPTGDEVQSPAPEKPYQGVGRLIDEWQRKTADADAPRSPVSRRKGGGGAGTGVTASPRRAGVIAGRGAQD